MFRSLTGTNGRLVESPNRGKAEKLKRAHGLDGTVRSWEVKMRKVGLDRLDVITIFKRTFADEVTEDPLIKSIAMAVGEVIEENNKKFLEELVSTSKREVSKL